MKKTIKIVTSLILAVLVILLAFVLLKGCGSSKVDKSGFYSKDTKTSKTSSPSTKSSKSSTKNSSKKSSSTSSSTQVDTPVYASPDKSSGVAYVQPQTNIEWDKYMYENGEWWYSFVQKNRDQEVRFYIAYSDIGY